MQVIRNPLFVTPVGVVMLAVLLAASPAVKPGPSSPPAPLSAQITVHLDLSAMSPIGIAPSDVEKVVSAFYKSHDIFNLEDLQVLEITGEHGAKARLSKIATVEVRFERSATTRPASEK